MKPIQSPTFQISRLITLICNVLITISLASISAHGGLRWVPRTDVGSPGPRYAHSMVYDPQTSLTVFFGGEYSVVGGDPEYFNDVWTYDGTRWTKVIITGPSPTPRSWASFGPYRDGLRLGQGIGYGGIEPQEWILKLTSPSTGTWSQIPLTQDRADQWLARGYKYFGGIFDDYADRDLMESSDKTEGLSKKIPMSLADFAGVEFPEDHQYSSRFLILGGGQFTEADFTDDPGVRPGGILEYFLTDKRDSWPPVGCAPKPQNRAQHTAAYDPIRNRVVLFGGAGMVGGERYWELAFDRSSTSNCFFWQKMDWVSNTPDDRAHAKMVYDEKRQVMVLFGGIGGPAFNRFGDTWELIKLPPEIYYNSSTPTNLDVCAGDTYFLYSSFAATPPYTVTWYRDGSGVNTGNRDYVEEFWNSEATLKYYYVLRDAADNVRTSINHIVTVHVKPSLILFSNEKACPGELVRLHGQVNSTLPVTIQWFHDGAPVGDPRDLPAGSHEIPLFIQSVKPKDSGFYTISARNRCGTSTIGPSGFDLKAGYLRVGPIIESHPVSATATVCDTHVFSAETDGVGPRRYQWRLDGLPLTNDTRISGADTNRLELRQLRHSQRGNYDVIVWDTCGREYAVTSRVATLKLDPGPEWLIRTNAGPSSRWRHTMAYDSARHVTVLFGGYYATASSQVSYNDLWEWDGSKWSQRTTNTTAGWETNPANGGWRPSYSNVPVGRAEHSMAYDPKRGRTVIFGGVAIDPSGSTHNLNDNWEWDGAQWYFRGTNGPGWRSSAGMTYDPERQTIALFGGAYASADPFRGAFWDWDGQTWKTRPTSGEVSTFANTISMTFDSFRNQIVYGPTYNPAGTITDRFWTLKGTHWTSSDSTFNLQETPMPFGSLAYDSDRRRSTYTFGSLGHTALGDGTSWELITNNISPSKRFWHASAYDSDRKVVVLFGGTFGFSSYYVTTNDTWELTYLDIPQIREHPGSQVAQLNTSLTFSANAVGYGSLSYQWLKNGEPIANTANITGATSAQLRLSNVSSNDIALYQVRVTNGCGSTVSRPAYLTLNPNLQILNTAGELSLLWNTSGSILEQADNVGGPWTPVPGASNPFTPGRAAEFKFYRLRNLP